MSSLQCWYPQRNLESVPFRAIWLRPPPTPDINLAFLLLLRTRFHALHRPVRTGLLTTLLPPLASLLLPSNITNYICALPFFSPSPVSKSSTFYSRASNRTLTSTKYLASNALPWSWMSGPHWICHCFITSPLSSRFCAPTVTLPVTPLQPGPQWEVTSHPLTQSQGNQGMFA